MRWVLTWKVIQNDQGETTGCKPKARLIVKGFQDLDLLNLRKESPTLSTQMPAWPALCDLGAPGWGEPWFPHSAVLLFLTCQLYGDM